MGDRQPRCLDMETEASRLTGLPKAAHLQEAEAEQGSYLHRQDQNHQDTLPPKNSGEDEDAQNPSPSSLLLARQYGQILHISYHLASPQL